MLRCVALCVGMGTLLAFVSPDDARAVVAACADGSIVLARRWQDVHCAGAVAVAPEELSRLGSPDRRRTLLARAAALRKREAARERDLEQQIEAVTTARRSAALRAVAITPAEHRLLARFIALRQRSAAAAVVREHRDGPTARLRFAHSAAFETRLRTILAASGRAPSGPILVFALEPASAALGSASPSFAQRGVTLRPLATDPRQLGWIGAESDAAAAPGVRLGYVALPASFDLGRPIVVFWGDAVATTRLTPTQR